MTTASDGFATDLTAADRSIQFRLAFNVRDLGGLRTVDGATVQRGRVFRADGVHRLRDDDLAAARSLGLRTVIDLRTAAEIGKGGRFPVEQYPVEWHSLPLLRRIWSDDDLVPTTGAADFLRDRYLDMLSEGAESLATIVPLIAEGHPALFHCAAGKDRTGVVAALLLGLVGVGRDDIVADYHATAGAMAAFVDWLTLEYPEAIDAMTSQPPEYLEAPPEAMSGFLDVVDERHGSMHGLAEHLGIAAGTVERLRETLLA
ncbi:MAG: tyrosine-protein phosphatase [Acidimicrobiales bacterium]